MSWNTNEVAYYVTGEDHYPVLENGEVVETVTPASELLSSHISLKFSDRELVRQFVQEMKSISSSITDKIVSVDLIPSKVTKDLVTITMKNDNKILVPVSQITRKLPYYKAISKQLDDDSTIDMEAGVFSYSEQSIADAKEQAEKKRAESTEKTRKNILRKQAKNRIQNRIQKEKILPGMSKAHKLSQIIEEKCPF